jgi:hypothetical protein
MASRDFERSDQIASRIAPEPRWRKAWIQPSRRFALGFYLLLGLALAVFGSRGLIEDAQDRAEAGTVRLEVHAFVPFGGGPGGWSGLLEIRNLGRRPVSVLDLGLPRPVVLLAVHDVPIQIEAGSTGRLTMRLRLDCGAGVATARMARPAIDVRARTDTGRERTERVQFADLATLVTQLENEQCGDSAGQEPQGLQVTYEGSELRGGAIETAVLVRNNADAPVTVLEITGSSGWPGSARTEPASLPATLPPRRAVQLRLTWDLSACPRIGADEVISSLRMVLISQEETLQLATFDLGAGFAGDFFRYYYRSCR